MQELDKPMTKVKKFSFPPIGQQLLFWFFAVAGCGFDLWSKAAVFEWLSKKPPYYEHVFIENFLRFVARQNAGAAFSIFAGKRIFLVGISLVAFIAIIAIFYSGTSKGKFSSFLLGLFLAGIGGNLYDRLCNNGLVRDFIDVYIKPLDYHWPTFNVADSLLCIAVALFVIHTIICEIKNHKKDKATN